MPPITTLAELKTYFEQAIQNGTLTLTPSNSIASNLQQAISNMPTGQLMLTTASLELAPGGDRLTLSGSGETWYPGRSGTRQLSLQTVRVVYTLANQVFNATLTTSATLLAGTLSLALAGQLNSSNQLIFQLQPGASRTLALAVLANSISDNQLAAYLPPGVTIFESVPLSALSLVLGLAGDHSVELQASIDLASSQWRIISALDPLRGLGVSLRVWEGYRDGQYIQTIGGDIHATFNIGQDFRVRLALQGQYDWEFDIIPADGNLLPGLSALAGLAGGATTQRNVEAGLRALGLSTLAIDQVAIRFDLAAATLQTVQIVSHVIFEDIRFDIQVSLPNFSFYGALSPLTPIHLRTLIQSYFAGAEHFPTIDITDISLTADPAAGSYSLYAVISTNWTFKIGKLELGIDLFDFEINKSPEGVTGFIEGYGRLFGASFSVLAEHPEVGAGWQFTCSTAPGQRMALKTIHDQIVGSFGVDATLPDVLKDLTIEKLYLWFDTASSDCSFSCELLFPIHDQMVDCTITIALRHDNGNYRKTFGGQVVIGDLLFDLHFQQNANSNQLVASYAHTGDARRLTLKDLAAVVSPSFANELPSDLAIDLKDALFAFDKRDTTQAKVLFGLDLSIDLSLNNLPLVGKEFPADQHFGLQSLRLLLASTSFTSTEITALNELLPAAIPRLPDAAVRANDNQAAAPNPPPPALKRGMTVAARLQLGNSGAHDLALPLDATASQANNTSSTAIASSPGTASGDTTKWFSIQKSLGPVHIARLGVQYRNKELRFLLDASLAMAGLTLSLDGLTLGSPIDHFAPSFDLLGLGIDYRSGPLTIGGALLRMPAGPGGSDEYSGAAVIRTSKLSLAALGSYTQVEGHPSLFVYAVLDQPLGGPAFFFVTGLAAGFGYNRRLVIPPIEGVASFPLITAANSNTPITGSDNPTSLIHGALTNLRSSIPPSAGDIFLAAGVRFTSFKVIDSFALLAVSFGNQFRLDLLGISQLVAPPPESGKAVEPLAEIQLALKASFVPDEGFLGVSAQLTSASYLFSRNCHLTGGFAFYSWFAGPHAGDFALTVGGYHPLFNPPAHYPHVPRLGFNWQYSDALSIKGDAYYALTPSALMAGGHLEVNWQSGNLRAWFNAGADFLIAWKPYHYDARVSVDIGAEYTFHFFGTHHISAHVGADLHIWGPDFAGTAHIKLSIISFDVEFGAHSPSQPTLIDWPEFKRSFLPADVCAVSLQSGLVLQRTGERGDMGQVDPQRLHVAAASVVPLTHALIGGKYVVPPERQNDRLSETPEVTSLNQYESQALAFTLDRSKNWFSQPASSAPRTTVGAVAVGPVGITPRGTAGNHLVSTIKLNISQNGKAADEHFSFTPVLKHLPAGMWGSLPADLKPRLSNNPDDQLVKNALTGFEIRPLAAVLPTALDVPDSALGPSGAADGTLQFADSHPPLLADGTYTIELIQTVSSTSQSGPHIVAEEFKNTRSFTVSSVRLTLEPGDIHGYFPPAGSLGDHAAVLPHIMLNNSSLPWVLSAGSGAPWLALLLFDEAATPQPMSATIGELKLLRPPLIGVGNGTPAPGTTLPRTIFPAFALLDGLQQPDSDTLACIDLAPADLSSVLPTLADLALLAHVRRRVDTNGKPLDTELAVVVGNRLPRAGARSTVHLVAINGALNPEFGSLPSTDRIRLVSLASWSFTCTSQDHNLQGLLNSIKASSNTLRLTSSAPTAEAAQQARGAVKLTHLQAAGQRSDTWYRGPCVPQPASAAPTLPVLAARELNNQDGVGGVSFAAAWELGRLLCLQSRQVALDLFGWKSARARQAKDQSQIDHLPLQGVTSAALNLPRSVIEWCADMALLKGLPFNYLVPDGRMLPTESLRFFSLDAGWLDCLFDGALSVGRTSPADRTADAVLLAELKLATWAELSQRAQPGSPGQPAALAAISGLLMRSDAVAGWPGLLVEARNAGGQQLLVLRREQLSPQVTLWLYAGEIQQLTIYQKPETLHFGIENPAGSWWNATTRVVKVATLAGQLADGHPGAARFARAMIDPSPSIMIERPAPARP